METVQAVDLKSALEAKLKSRQAKVGIIGLGYVGLPLALLFAEEHFPVTGFDIDPEKIHMLSSGGSYIYRIPPTEIQLAKQRGFIATNDYRRMGQMDAIVVCVPTPLNAHREPDLSYIIGTMEAMAPHVVAGQLIVLESTTYPGTTEEVVVPILESKNQHGLHVAHGSEPDKNQIYVAFSPEREDPGNNTVARRDIPKVAGGVNTAATELTAALYGTIFRRVVSVSSPAVAEMTKLLENIYRCVNIALVNELKLLCLRMGLDLWEVIDAAATKPFGFQPFYPGPGLGGHCIPVDPFYLSWKAREWDFHTRFIELAGEINLAMPYHVVQQVAVALGIRQRSLNGSRILLLGAAYKKDVDDVRESPALTIIELLQDSGADISYNDPYVPKLRRGRKYDLHLDSIPLNDLGSYDCVLIVTDHSDYDYARIVRESQLVVDTRNATRGIHAANLVRC